jgi:hypothetical protein
MPDALTKYYEEKHAVPDSLEAIGIGSQIGKDIHLAFDSKHMVVTVETAQGHFSNVCAYFSRSTFF